MPTVKPPSEPDWLVAARLEGRVLNETPVRGMSPTTAALQSPAAREMNSPAPTPQPALLTTAPRRMVLEIDVPIRTTSEANAGGKLREKIARKSALKTAMAEALPTLATPFPLPVRVTLTRFGARELDGDNLQRSLKAVRDSVAAWLGLDDRDRRIRWRYRQQAAWTPFVRIRILSRGFGNSAAMHASSEANV